MSKNFSCGNRIKELRTARALSQERLALNAGITPTYLGMIERGEKNATVAIIEKICEALGIRLADFFSDDNTPGEEMTVEKQIAAQLTGLSEGEKQTVLQLVKTALHLRQSGIESAKLAEE